jgi:BON domain
VLDLKQVDIKQVSEDVADRVTQVTRDIMSSDVADRARDLGADVAERVGRAARELGTGAANAARELSSTAEDSVRKQLPRRRGMSPWAIIAGGVIGAIAVYLFDPQQGKGRRALLMQWSAARVRRGARMAGQLGRYTGNIASAAPQRVVSIRSGQPRQTPDDMTLRDRVESEVFRDPDIPKGQINFDVNAGIVTIRGEVDNAFRIATIEKAVFNVSGVAGVENLLHVGGTPAPNKAEAREARG